ncbi:MAG: hypothetical protein ACI4XJ_10835 [Eubacteriales bacterium]
MTGASELIDESGGRVPENMKNTYVLHRTSLTDGTNETVADGLLTPNFLVTDGYIFTLDGISAETKGSTELLHGCVVYRMKHDGSGRTRIAESDKYSFMYRQFSSGDILIDSYEDEENTCLALAFCVTDENGDTVPPTP